MAQKEKTDRWAEDTMIAVSRDTRAKLKMKALQAGKSVKQYLKEVAEKK